MYVGKEGVYVILGDFGRRVLGLCDRKVLHDVGKYGAIARSRWTILTSPWKSIFSLKKKKLEGVVNILIGKLYGKVRYFEDVNYFKDFEAEFPAIVFNDAFISKPEVPPEPTVSTCHVKKTDFDFVISFDESDDEDYTFTYDKNFSYKLVSDNDFKSDPDNDDKINVETSSRDVLIESLNDVVKIDVISCSNAFEKNILRYEGHEYTDVDILDFEERLGRIYDRQVHRVQALDFTILTEEMREAMGHRLSIEHTDAQGRIVFTSYV
ncbi:hypothetical protein Tco_1313847 [Tanacetum coccineum]